MPAPIQFGEADLEDDFLAESASSCSYAATTLRAPPPSAALLQLSGLKGVLSDLDEPLRESREPFRLAVRDAIPESTREAERPASVPPATIEEALIRAARTSFASEPRRTSDRPSGVRVSAPHTIEEAVLRVVDQAADAVEVERAF